jgi:hypothetical protein
MLRLSTHQPLETTSNLSKDRPQKCTYFLRKKGPGLEMTSNLSEKSLDVTSNLSEKQASWRPPSSGR